MSEPTITTIICGSGKNHYQIDYIPTFPNGLIYQLRLRQMTNVRKPLTSFLAGDILLIVCLKTLKECIIIISRISALPVLDPDSKKVLGILDKGSLIESVAKYTSDNYQHLFELPIKVCQHYS